MSDVIAAIQKRADTVGLYINAAGVSRVLAVQFDVLAKLLPADAMNYWLVGMARAEKRAEAAKAARKLVRKSPDRKPAAKKKSGKVKDATEPLVGA